MKKLRIACIGFGTMGGDVHMPFHAKNERVEIVGLCDIRIERCHDMIRDFNLPADTPIFTDYKEMIDTVKPDAVDIATPNKYHSIIACYALERGIHVFCEKPDAINAVEVKKMKDASEAAGKVLMVMRNNRYYGNSKTAKKFLQDGGAGEIYCGRCGWLRRRGLPDRDWFSTKEESGGGPLIDLGVHMIDLSIWLMGNPKPVSVSACTYSKFTDKYPRINMWTKEPIVSKFDVEDLAIGFIRFDNGACLQLEFSWASNIEEEHRFVELRGDKAGIRWNDNGTLDIFTEKNNELVDLHPECVEGHGHHEALQHFVDIVLDGREPDYVPEQGLNMVKILDAIYESTRTGHEVLL